MYEANSLALDLAFDISRLTYYPDTRNEDDFIEILTNHSIKVNILHNQVLQTQSERNFRAATECIQPITAIFEDPEAAISAPINIKEEIPSPAQENNREDDFDQELHKLTNVDQFFLPDAEEIEDQHSEENNSGDDSKVQSGKRKCRDPSKELEDSSFDAYSSSGTSDSDKASCDEPGFSLTNTN